jgi:predicted PurR-regulated permease PerM
MDRDGDREPFLSTPFVARAARWGLLAWSIIGVLILVGVFYRFVLYPVRIIFPPIVVGLVVIYLLNPLVGMMERRGVGRLWGTLAVYVVVLSAVGLAVASLTAVIGHQVGEFVRSVPDLLSRAQRGLSDFVDRLGIHVDTTGLVEAFQQNGSAYNFLVRITRLSSSGVVHVATTFALGPLIAFYLLVDLPKIRRGAESLMPAPRRGEILDLAGRVGETVGGFFRGQLLVAFMLGLASMLGFYVLGVPYFALLGALTGLFALVPLIGVLIAAVPVLFVAFTASGHGGQVLGIPGGWKLALACAVLLILVQQLDTRLLGPRFSRRASRLHPVTTLLSLLVGGTLLGLSGMLLAVPVVAAAKVVALHVWDTRSQWPPGAESSGRGVQTSLPTVVPPPEEPRPIRRTGTDPVR